MFVAYDVAGLIVSLREIVPTIQRANRDLADQLSRAATSVLFNLAEVRRSTTAIADSTTSSIADRFRSSTARSSTTKASS